MATERVLLQARLAPQDHEAIVTRAKDEGRSLGEMLAIMVRETAMLKAQQRQEVGADAGK